MDTRKLEAALKQFQKDLGVEPIESVDAATLAALEEALIALRTPSPPPTSSPQRLPLHRPERSVWEDLTSNCHWLM
jgi:hypothetical protein